MYGRNMDLSKKYINKNKLSDYLSNIFVDKNDSIGWVTKEIESADLVKDEKQSKIWGEAIYKYENVVYTEPFLEIISPNCNFDNELLIIGKVNEESYGFK